MRILAIQESDWLEKGPHQSHHLLERLTLKGHEVEVIDFQIMWQNVQNESLLSRRLVFDSAHKATSNGNVRVIRPAFIRVPIADYISVLISHSIEIRRQIREFRPDIIVAFGILNTYLAELASRRKNIPLIYYVIDELHRLVPQKSLQPIARLVESRNMRNATLLLTTNEKLMDYCIGMGAARERTKIIRDGIDFGTFNPKIDGKSIREKFGVREDEILLFFMGWLYVFSGLIEVADTILADSDKYSKLKMMIVGKGEAEQHLRQVVAKGNAGDRILLFDWMPYHNLSEYVAASDICIAPSQNHEIMRNIVPIKIYEYMAAGKPVIATRLEGVVREFGDASGVVYVDDPRDVPDEAVRLDKEQLVKILGQNAYEFVRRSDWTVITEEFESILGNLCGSKSRGGNLS